MILRSTIKPGPALAFLFGLAVAALAWIQDDAAPERSAQAADPAAGKAATKASDKADNSLCYVCHLYLKDELITKLHQAQNIGCVDCHGPSSEHMHDEMLMTTPDVLHGRHEVPEMCGACHDDPHADKREEVAAFLKHWEGRERPNGRAVTKTSICTDCHGTHNINPQEDSQQEKQQQAEWSALFNSQDLAGWKPSGKAQWKVKFGRLVGSCGEEAAGGILWADGQHDDFLLSVTFRVDWPIHAAIIVRADQDQPGSRIEIFQSEKPAAHTGSVTAGGQGLALLNLRDDLFDPAAWNTISAEVRGDRLQVWVNGEEIGAVRAAGAQSGRIGLQLVGGDAFSAAKFSVREVLVQRRVFQEALDSQ